jgi:hypothetical protein
MRQKAAMRLATERLKGVLGSCVEGSVESR